MRRSTLQLIAIAFTTLFCTQAHSQVVITTVAGTPNNIGYSGDLSSAIYAYLGSPSDVVTDDTGNIYIADFLNNVIRKVDTFGVITTIAGTGFGASTTTGGTGAYTGDNGPATAAELNGPYALTFDKHGNLFFADGYNHVVRKINLSGTITTVAGIHTAGYGGDGGPATAAMLNNPVGVVVDTADNLYIADDHNNVVRMVNPAGIISTIAGNDTAGHTGNGGPATHATLSDPLGVALDKAGNLYIADGDNNVIRKVSTTGIISDYVGFDTTSGYTGDHGPATAAQLKFPVHIRFDDSDNLYIPDANNNVIRKVSTAGIITTIAGDGIASFTGDGGDPTLAELFVPQGVCVTHTGIIYIADRGNEVIRKIGPADHTGVQNVKGQNASGINVYPNPVNTGTFTLQLSSIFAEDIQLSIVNTLGETVQHFTATTNKPLNVSCSFAPGVYFISGVSTHGNWNKQIVVR